MGTPCVRRVYMALLHELKLKDIFIKVFLAYAEHVHNFLKKR